MLALIINAADLRNEALKLKHMTFIFLFFLLLFKVFWSKFVLYFVCFVFFSFLQFFFFTFQSIFFAINSSINTVYTSLHAKKSQIYFNLNLKYPVKCATLNTSLICWTHTSLPGSLWLYLTSAPMWWCQKFKHGRIYRTQCAC